MWREGFSRPGLKSQDQALWPRSSKARWMICDSSMPMKTFKATMTRVYCKLSSTSTKISPSIGVMPNSPASILFHLPFPTEPFIGGLMSETARPKYSSTAPSGFHSDLPQNPRKEFRDPTARPSGKSGGVAVDTPHRVSSSRRGKKKEGRRS